MTRPESHQITQALIWSVEILDADPWESSVDQQAIVREMQVKTLNEWWRVA